MLIPSSSVYSLGRLYYKNEALQTCCNLYFDADSQNPSGYGLGGPPQAASSGYPGPSKRIEIPNGRVGVIIGKGGETIKYLQLQSGAKIQVTRDMDADPNSATRGVDLMGTSDQVMKAEQLIQDVLSEVMFLLQASQLNFLLPY